MAEPPVPNPTALRAELDSARNAFHDLCEPLDAAGWRRRSRNPAWTVGEVLTHTTFYLTDVVPLGIEGALAGRAVSGMPPWLARSFLAHPLNVAAGRWQARRTNPVMLLEHYDRAHERVLDLIQSTPSSRWSAATFTLGRTMTVAELFAVHPVHWREHALEVVERRRR